MTYFIDTTDKRNQFFQKFLDKKGFKTATYENISQLTSGDKLIFSPSKKFDDNFADNLPAFLTIFCGKVSEHLEGQFFKKNIIYKNLLCDEIFAIKNAKLTAEGILANILQYSEKSVFENNILILGSGRVGKATALLFEKLGVKYSLVSHTKNNYYNNNLFNCTNFFANEFKEKLSEFDVIINTIPAKILFEQDLEKISKDCIFLEIASLQTIDVSDINFTYLLCPALPQKFCAESAGKVLFDYIMRIDKS